MYNGWTESQEQIEARRRRTKARATAQRINANLDELIKGAAQVAQEAQAQEAQAAQDRIAELVTEMAARMERHEARVKQWREEDAQAEARIAAIGWNDDRPKADRTPALKKILDSLPARELRRILAKIERVKAKSKKPAKGTRQA